MRCLTGYSNLIQKHVPVGVLPKVKWAKPETCLLDEFLLMVDDLQLVLLHNLDGALYRK